MLALLIFPGGRKADAVLLSISEDCIRAAIAGRRDVTELFKIAGRWISESGVPVEIAAIFRMENEGIGMVQTEPRALAVGLPC